MTIYTYRMLRNEYPLTYNEVLKILDEQIGICSYEWLPNLLTTKTFRRILAAVLCEQVSKCGRALNSALIYECLLTTADNIVRAAGYVPDYISEDKRTMIIRSYLSGVADQYNSADEI